MHIGVDGCRAGWFAVNRRHNRLEYVICPTIQNLIMSFPKAKRILVDIPIGLPWKGAEIRPCDRLARSVLGSPRMSSVFPVPCREAAHAKSIDQARALNIDILGRNLSAQTWGICAKIAEVDDLLQESPAARTHI